MSVTTSTEQWADKYRDGRPRYEWLANRFQDLLTQLLKNEGLDVVQITSRAKTVDSFLSKLKRKNKYAEPLEEVTDLAGVRIVTYYLEDVDTVEGLVRSEFTIDEERSVTKGREALDRFGYQSRHLIVSLDQKRKDSLEWKDLRDLRAEIQIRTATQHAWAAVEHKLGYKNPNVVDAQIARQLFRLSALFELADEQFSQVRSVTAKVERTASENVMEGDLEIGVDLSSLHAYLESDQKNIRVARAVATAGGWTVKETDDKADPARRERDLRDLARSLKEMHIDTVGRFDQILARAEEVSAQMEHVAELERNDMSGRAHPNAEAFPEDILNILVFLLEKASPELVQSVYGGVTARAIEDAIGEDRALANNSPSSPELVP
jgi:putative GTP pyrophosphokinase